MSKAPLAPSKFTEEQTELLEQAVTIGREMQHRFQPEPFYKLTGKGYLKSEGVEGISRVKEEERRAKGIAR